MSINVCNDRSMASITSLPSGVSGSSLVLLETTTISSSTSTVSFTSNIDSTYKEYLFTINNVHPSATGEVNFMFNFTTDGTNFNVTKTTTFFLANHNEEDNTTGLAYFATRDLAQSTDDQRIMWEMQNDNDDAGSGTMHLFEPSSTTFVKHFISTTNVAQVVDYSVAFYVAGYGNTTSAVNAIQFKMSAGNIDSGVIKLYGIS